MKKNLRIKVCGMRDPENIRDVLKLEIDFMGFIFYRSSPRNAKIIPDGIDFGNTKKVGVFVNSTVGEIIKTTMSFGLDYIQLHGEETPEFCREVKNTGKKIIKVFSVGDDFDFSVCEEYMDVAEYFLFDTKGELKGGNGELFDWNKLEEYYLAKPFLLSGGISPEHKESVKKFSHPQFAGIDINSGFETEPGIKNYKSIKKFLNELRN